MRQSGYFNELIATLLERRFLPSPVTDHRGTEALCRTLMSESGDVTTVKLGREILQRYWQMAADEKLAFFRFLATALDLDAALIERLAHDYRYAPTTGGYAALVQAAEPRRQELLRRLNRVPGATGQLVAMRRDLFALAETHPDLARIDLDFEHLLSSWFNPGFLVLKRIDWHSPAAILEKIIAYEAVHAIGDWEELRRRLQPADRRCFAYFHPTMPDEPLIFVEVALSHGVPGSIQAVLEDARAIVSPEAIDTAVFYSISNCQRGLRGVSFGNSLIKQVVEQLSAEMPRLTTFVTLSPIPGLARWIEANGLADEPPCRAAARYLVEAKRGDGAPLDSVARFHLGNGAAVHDIHADADLSPNGLKQSGGVMVNYLYDLDKLDANIAGYFSEREVAVSAKVRALLKPVAGRRARKDRTDG